MWNRGAESCVIIYLWEWLLAFLTIPLYFWVIILGLSALLHRLFFSNLLLNPFPPFCYCNQLFKIVWSIKFYKVTWFILANLTHNRFHSAIQTAKTLLPGARHIPITSEDCGLRVRDWNLCSCEKNKYNWMFNKRHFFLTHFFLRGGQFLDTFLVSQTGL